MIAVALLAMARGPYSILLSFVAGSEEIRRAIADELAEPKYRLDEPWYIGVIAALERAWVRFVEWALRISEYVGGPVVLALLVGGTLLVAAALVTANLGRRRARTIDERIRREHESSRGLDPDELEERADQAESAGDYATAFRLLFRAGLIRLDRAQLIDLRPSTTSSTISEDLDSPQFRVVVERFDSVVYGDKPATPEDPDLVRNTIGDLLGIKAHR